MEHWNEVNPKERIHGYTGGQFVFEDGASYERYWPRVAVKRRDGGLNLSPDHSFTLREGDFIVTAFDSIEEDDSDITTVTPGKTLEDFATEGSSLVMDSTPLQLLEHPLDEQAARERMGSFPRLNLSFEPQHRKVRQEEQRQCEDELRKSRSVWLAADWATEEGFIAACVHRLSDAGLSPEVFHLHCGDAQDIDAFEAIFPQQFGFSLQATCALLVSLKDAFLLLDGIHPSLCVGEPLKRLRQIVAAITDYCPHLKTILVSRLTPEAGAFPIVEIRGLDVHDVRTYLTHHPDAEPWLLEADVVERLHERSEGLPIHLDKMLKALQVSSLASVLETDMESASLSPESESAPKALVHEIAGLAQSEDKRSQRSFRLLKVLSMLPYGETLDALSHYLPTEPFFDGNAIQLKDLALLDVIPLQALAPQIDVQWKTTASQVAPKLLKAPRQVRDYIQSLLTDDEREQIVLAGIERFFGKSWREGKIKLRKIPIGYREYLSSGAGNEFALMHHLIAQGRKKNDKKVVERGAKLGIHYLEHLLGADRYRDVVIVAGALLQIVDRDEHLNEWSALAAVFGKALRMTGKHDESIQYLKEAIEYGKLKDYDRASTWLNIALIEDQRKHKDAAIAAIEEVTRLTKEDSAIHLHALAIRAGLTLADEPRLKELTNLAERARKLGWTGLADNIALGLVREENRPDKKVAQLDKVLAGQKTAYTQARAIVFKAEAVQELKIPTLLEGQDLHALSSAYSYLHGQRFGVLFDRAHEQLWRIFEARNDTAQLLRLFRHTSFLWRIRGEEAKETEYLRQLKEIAVPKSEEIDHLPTKGFVSEVGYFLRRIKALLTEAANIGMSPS